MNAEKSKTVVERCSKSGLTRRRGLSLMIVMVAISVSVVLTLSFVRTQTANLQIHMNASGRDLARSAAQTGAAVAMQKIDASDWGGISSTLSATIHSDSAGDTTYSVVFLPLDTSHMNPLPEDAGLYLVIRSTGRWQSKDNASNVVEKTVELIVHLEPRVPGRPIYPGDSAVAQDLNPNPGSFDAIQNFALFAVSGVTSLILDPQDRIEGDIYLNLNLQLYQDPSWGSGVRADYLTSIGKRYVSGTSLQHPHPLAGQLTFRNPPSSSIQSDLLKLKVPWTTTSETPTVPAIDFDAWMNYQLYEGGPTYAAQTVGSYLDSVTLRPTLDNPLGIFYRNGSVQVNDDVIIQGTLVATDTVVITGENARICSYNWKGTGGTPIVKNVDFWPRLPAIAARRVLVDRNIRSAIEGAIVVTDSLDGAGGDYELFNTTNVDITGTATSSPVQQPWSKVTLQQPVDLSSVDNSGRYEIWLQDGNSGGWFTIVNVDAANRELTVIGEVKHSSAVSYRIRPGRLRFIDIRGPICGSTFNINRPNSWAVPSSTIWNTLWTTWKLVALIDPTNHLVDWLADANNLIPLGLPYPLSVYGLPLEPTFHARNTTGIHYRWEPPLFRQFAGSGAEEEYAGYRWRVVSWRELP